VEFGTYRLQALPYTEPRPPCGCYAICSASETTRPRSPGTEKRSNLRFAAIVFNGASDAIPTVVRRAAWLFRKLGRPLGQQHRIEVWIDGVEVPVLGYADFLYPEFVLDLKTTFAIPSKPRADHEAQIVTYADALGRRPGLVYVSPQKIAVYQHGQIDVAGARRLLRQSASAVRAMLAAADSRETAAALFVPVDDFRWSPATALRHRRSAGDRTGNRIVVRQHCISILCPTS
jgi:hypothetical protein